MTAFTPVFALPYPDGSDAPCDFAEQWCDFTDAIDVVLDRFQTTLDRTVPMIPIAAMIIPLDAPITITAFNNIPYDTLVIDSAGWTAIDVDNTMISPDMAGVLTYQASVVYQQAQAAGAFLLDPQDSLGLLTEPTLPYADQMDTNTAHVGIPLSLPVLFSPGTWQPGFSGIRNGTGVNVVATVTVLAARYSVYWHSDGGTV